jgi:hypothetical protein
MTMSRPSRLARPWALSFTVTLAAATLLTSAACSKKDSPIDTSGALAPADASVPPPDVPPATLRGTVASINDTSVTVTTSSGSQVVHLVAPLHVYTRTKSDLSHVTPNAFVGITSVTQADGSQRATEIHIFPEALRGTGEGSRMMDTTGGSASPSRMTNGSVSTTTTGAGSGSRMTNGSVTPTRGTGGTSYTVTYEGGTQTIAIPPNVAVTAITPTQSKPAVGANVIVIANKDAAGRQNSSTIFLLGADAPK